MLNKHTYKGTSLIELLIGLGVCAFLIAGLIVFYTNITSSSNIMMRTIRLEHELNTALAIMQQDIRRAGYNSRALKATTNGSANPFTITDVSDLTLVSDSCLLFSYDLNQTGELPDLNTTPNDDRFGFRLIDNTLQSRAKHDSVFSCIEGTWYDLTNKDLFNIDNLQFTLTTTTVDTTQVRVIGIELTGSLLLDPTVKRTLQTKVKIRNDKSIS